MTATGTRAEARKSLTGKWGKGALITLCYSIVEGAISMIQNIGQNNNNNTLQIILSILASIISIPLSYGLLVSFIKLKRDEEVNTFDFLTIGFSNFSRAWLVALNVFVKMILPIGLIVLSLILTGVFTALATTGNSVFLVLMVFAIISCVIGYIWAIVRSFSLVLAYYIAYDEPDLSAYECCKKSIEKMKGNRGNYFVLSLSFIGWAFLAVLTLGIGFFWLIPYINVSYVCFYEEVMGKKEENNEEVKAIEE
jgi:uncharacterized membrane protein